MQYSFKFIFAEYNWLQHGWNRLSISKKNWDPRNGFGTSSMGSLLPHREDIIPKLDQLLAPMLNFIPMGVGFLDQVGLQEKRISLAIWEKRRES